jgi:hypothetical protein
MPLHYIVPIWIGASLIIAAMGSKMRFGFWGYLFASILLTPIIGILLLAAGYPPKQAK